MLQRVQTPAGPVFYRSPLLAKIGVPHAFSTRLGGVSEGRFASLNLGNPSEGTERDSSDNIESNYRRLCDAAGLPSVRCSVHQVHGPVIVQLEHGFPFVYGQKADGIVSIDSTRSASIRVADCVPVLLASEDGSVVAAIHAGWRGVVSGAVLAALHHRWFSGSKRVFAAIGPCISRKHFEVGPEVVAEFVKAFGSTTPIERQNPAGKGFVDLPGAIEQQLRGAGLAADQIDRTDRCSFEHTDEFFSHRRDQGVTGRMAALIAPRPS